MNLEDIKEWRETAYLSFDTIPEISRIDWLIAEVERLKGEIDICHSDTRQATAQRCAEIGEDLYKAYEATSARMLIAAIRKEFDL